MKILTLLSNKYFKFSLAAIAYILWVVWVGSYWLLVGLPIIFDIYITKKVNWAFWKKREGKNSTLVEWIDALIFAVIAVTLINIFLFQNFKIPTGSMEKTLLIGDHLFVSKVGYGPRIPNTPLSFPFTQHTMPLIKTKSYLEWIKWPYKRLKGMSEVKNDDIVVFNFPAGDTVAIQQQARSYYSIIRDISEEFKMRDSRSGLDIKPDQKYLEIGRTQVQSMYDIVYRPVDKRDNYIKRCIAIPGDTLIIRNGNVFVNGKPQVEFEKKQAKHFVFTNGTKLNPKTLERMSIYQSDVYTLGLTEYMITMTEENAGKIAQFKNVKKVEIYLKPKDSYAYYIFPHDERYPWNEDNFGPLWMPLKGSTIHIDTSNISKYERIIEAYENNKLEVRNDKIYINDQETSEYTFKMGYYWMMGDNRHDSADSRFWGFVPEDHIVGKPKYVWLSLDKEKTFLAKIRFRRMFMKIQ